MLLSQLTAKVLVFDADIPLLERPPDGQDERVEIDRLGEVVRRPRTHGFDGRPKLVGRFAEAAITLPREPLVAQARARALGYLVAAAKAGVSDVESALWARLVLRGLDPAAASSIVPPGGTASEAYESLRSALADSRMGAKKKPQPARTPFDRLLVTIGRRNLKVVRG